MGLHLSNQSFWTAEKLFCILTYRKLWDINNNENYAILQGDPRIKNFFSGVVRFSTDIGISIDARNFLVEEQMWLEKYLTIDFRQLYSELFQKISIIINDGRNIFIDFIYAKNVDTAKYKEYEYFEDTIPSLLSISSIKKYLNTILKLCKKNEFYKLKRHSKSEFGKIIKIKKYSLLLKQYNIYHIIEEISRL